MTSETSPISGVESYDYDAADRLIEMTDRRGWVTEHGYDDLDRLTSEEWLSGSTVIETLSFDYDSRSNMTSVTQSGSGTSGGGGGGMGGPGGPGGGGSSAAVVTDRHVTFSHDPTGQFSSIVRYDASTADPAAKIAQSDYTYDSASRLITLDHTKDAVPSGTITVASYDYTYDMGNRISSLAR